MNLVVDIGNTRIKWGVFKDLVIVETVAIEPESFESALNNLTDKYPIDQIMVCATGKSGHIVTLLKKSGLSVQVLDHKTPVPFINRYNTPETLGLDRIALVSASAKAYPKKNVLIIDAGTCVTFDFKNDKDEYLGGSISPGLRMRYRALHTFTEKLPELKVPEGVVSMIGMDTQTAIHSGVVRGFIAEMEGVINWYQANYADLTIILTGGDCLFLYETLKNGIFANSNFLLEGLNYLIVFNKNQ